MRTRTALLLFAVLIVPTAASAKEHPSLTQARSLYNAGDFDGAIAAAGIARNDAGSADAAALVAGRAHLERYRVGSNDAADLNAGRAALASVRMALLMPRDQVDLLVGLGQALFLTQTFGAAAELFESALGRAAGLPYRDRGLLLDWWATAVDREAQGAQPDRRVAALRRVMERMDEELALDASHPAANYWLAVAARGTGDLDRAWHAAAAAWVRASLRPESAMGLRQDLDRFMTTVLIPERARERPARDQTTALTEYREQWDALKEQWK